MKKTLIINWNIIPRVNLPGEGKLPGDNSMLKKGDHVVIRNDVGAANSRSQWWNLNWLNSRIKKPTPWGNILPNYWIFIILWELAWNSHKSIYDIQVIMNNCKDSKGASKGIKNQMKQTKGLPKESNFYGSRVFHSTRFMKCFMGCVFGNANRRGRDTDIVKIQTRSYCSVQNKNIISEFDKIVLEARKHPQGLIDRNIYKFMLDKNLYYQAYDKIKLKPGNMTQGLYHETLDGMSDNVIENICEKLRDETFQFKPARRIFIAKSKGGNHPLTIASPRDKLVQQVMVSILEPIFEPTFSEASHGFRPNKSIHTALKAVEEKLRVCRWVIEGDISKCFDSFDHKILIEIIRKRIKCQKFINLISKALSAGFGEEGKTIEANIIGTPKGSILSPLLCNIYMNEFDKFVMEIKKNFDNGTKVLRNKEYHKLATRLLRKIKTGKEPKENVKKEKQNLLNIKHGEFEESEFRRISFIRYADDWVLGIRGSRKESLEIKNSCQKFLKERLRLDLSEEKTKITNLLENKVKFLGCKLYLKKNPNLTKINRNGTTFKRRNSLNLIMEAPIKDILNKLEEAGFAKGGKSVPKGLLIHKSKEQIVNIYNVVFRGFLNFYSFAYNRGGLVSLLRHILWFSCGKTLAVKFKAGGISKIINKFGADFKGNSKISFYKPDYKIIKGSQKFKINTVIKTNVSGLYGDPISKAKLFNMKCKFCESEKMVEMHHIRMMRDIKHFHDKISEKMIKENRKQIPLCRKCHKMHHSNKLASNKP